VSSASLGNAQPWWKQMNIFYVIGVVVVVIFVAGYLGVHV
jgi:hypothetical protein